MDGSSTESSSEDNSNEKKMPVSALSPAQTTDMLKYTFDEITTARFCRSFLSTVKSAFCSDITEQCANFGLGDSILEKEALAAIREIGFAVRMISLPESLPRTADLIFMNLITLEDRTYCIELTQRGWRVASVRHDSMNGDYRQLDLHTRYFETIYQLLNVISPEFRNQFASKLSNKLIALTNGVSSFKGGT